MPLNVIDVWTFKFFKKERMYPLIQGDVCGAKVSGDSRFERSPISTGLRSASPLLQFTDSPFLLFPCALRLRPFLLHYP